MRWSSIACAGLLWTLCSPSLAADLAKIDRNIGKLPELKSEQPGYCLLVFGPDAATRVWLVRDGDLLYVDRNGNGDLTEPDEQVAAEANIAGSQDGAYSFKAGNIRDGVFQHKDLRVNWFNIDHLDDQDPRVKARLLLNPKFRACRIYIDVDMPGQTGRGIGGRLPQEASWQDKDGLLEFADSPQNAPIVHFGGPWQIGFYSTEPWHVGQANKTYLAMGTPGIGGGSTVFVRYAGVIPAGNNPVLHVTFPAATVIAPLRVAANGGRAPLVSSYELTNRCCGVNLYGNVEVPAEVVPGVAKVEVSLPSWPGATVDPSTTDIQVLPAIPPPKSEPISWRLKGTLRHVNKDKKADSQLFQIQFSPDGKRLIAGDYPGGIVHVWDLSSGERIATLETGEGPRQYSVSPDWRTLYALTNNKGRKYERIEKDGKVMMRWSFDDSIRVWDLESGKLLRTLQHQPPREINHILYTSDGKYLLTNEGLPGDYEGTYARACSLWDLSTGERRDISEQGAASGALSTDGKVIALSITDTDQDRNGSFSKAITLYDFPSWTERTTIPITSSRTYAQPLLFTSDGSMLIASLTAYDKPGNWRERQSFLKIWDAATGEEFFELPATDHNESISSVVLSPDGRTIAVGNYRMDGGMARVHLVDLTTKSVQTIDLGEKAIVRQLQFHPSGRWLAVPTFVITRAQAEAEVPADQLPQPRLHVVDTATGKIVETLVAPHSVIASESVKFSADGNTLATGGNGEVLLWDFSTPPGIIR